MMSPSPYLTPPPTNPHTRANSIAPNFNFSIVHPSSFTAHQPPRTRNSTLSTIRSVSEDQEAQEEDRSSPNIRADKRRRVTKSSRTANADSVLPSPSKTSHHSNQGSSVSPTSPHGTLRSRRGPNLAPIKPIGFAASRESRREDGTDQSIPSPVVMGFDFKGIDEMQLRTVGLTRTMNTESRDQAEAIRSQVRDTINIKEQQQALIAQRRREVVASTPSTPKELTFKGWTPKDTDRSGGVGRRREKTRDKVEGMSIVTSASEKDIIPGSKVRKCEKM